MLSTILRIIMPSVVLVSSSRPFCFVLLICSTCTEGAAVAKGCMGLTHGRENLPQFSGASGMWMV